MKKIAHSIMSFTVTGVVASALSLTFVLTALQNESARAGAIVYDPTNWMQNFISAVQNVQQAIYEAQQISQQIMQIQNEVQMLVNQGKMLMQLPNSLQSDIINSIRDLEVLIANSRGLIMDYNGLQTQFDDIYRTADYSGWTGADYQNSATALSNETIDAANNAMEAQGLIADLDQDRMALDSLLGSSKTAQGQLQALQAANEIAGVMTINLMRLETIMAESARAETTHIAAITKAQQDANARFKAGLDALKELGMGTPTFTPVNDDKFLNPIGTKKGVKN